MQAIILPFWAPWNPGVGLKGQKIFFLKVVMLYIKLKGMKRTITGKQIVYPFQEPSTPWDRV